MGKERFFLCFPLHPYSILVFRQPMGNMSSLLHFPFTEIAGKILLIAVGERRYQLCGRNGYLPHQAIIHQGVGVVFSQGILHQGRTSLGTEEFKNALAYFTDLYVKEGVVPPGPVEVDYSASMELFTGEQTGMILSGPHSLGFITKQNPGLEGKLGSFTIPMAKGGKHVSISGIGGYTITESCEHKEVAADYLKFFTNEENALYFGQMTGRMPVRSDAADDPFFSTQLFNGFLQAMDYCIPTKTFPAYPALLDTVGEAYSNILSCTSTLQEAFKTLNTKAQEVIAEASE